MPSEYEVGHWTTLEERIKELTDRLMTWHVVVTGGPILEEIFGEAAKNFAGKVDATVNPYDIEEIAAVEAIEQAIASFDSIYIQTRGIEYDGYDPGYGRSLNECD